MREIKALEIVRAKEWINFVQLKDICWWRLENVELTVVSKCLVLEYCHFSLQDIINNRTLVLSAGQKKGVIEQLLTGLMQLHGVMVSFCYLLLNYHAFEN